MYKNILLATDLSEGSDVVVKKAVKLAENFSANLTLVHTVEPLPAYGYPGISEIESPLIEQAKKRLSELGGKYDIAKDNQRLELGSVRNEVLDLAKKEGFDLILVGSHSRHGLSRLLGSNANAIVHGAESDVFVLRYKK